MEETVLIIRLPKWKRASEMEAEGSAFLLASVGGTKKANLTAISSLTKSPNPMSLRHPPKQQAHDGSRPGSSPSGPACTLILGSDQLPTRRTATSPTLSNVDGKVASSRANKAAAVGLELEMNGITVFAEGDDNEERADISVPFRTV